MCLRHFQPKCRPFKLGQAAISDRYNVNTYTLHHSFILHIHLNQVAPENELTKTNFKLPPKWGFKTDNRKPFLEIRFCDGKVN